MSENSTQTLVLLQRWHAGDRAALESLLERDQDWVRDHVRRRLGPLLRAKGEIDDYVQEAMVEAIQYCPRFLLSDKTQFRALLARITENVLRGQVDKFKAHKRDAAREQPVPTDSVLALDPPVQSVTRPSVAAHREEENAWIRLAIELLDPDDRKIVHRREWEQATFAEIGTELGIPEDTARMRFNRLLPKLARRVEMLRQGRIGDVLATFEDAG